MSTTNNNDVALVIHDINMFMSHLNTYHQHYANTQEFINNIYIDHYIDAMACKMPQTNLVFELSLFNKSQPNKNKVTYTKQQKPKKSKLNTFKNEKPKKRYGK